MSTKGHDVIAAIRAARQAKALTQKELGRRIGLPQSHISKIENGSVDLQLSSLIEIARALELEVTLVPRGALPAVEGTLRAVGTTVETSRALAKLGEQAALAERIKTNYPGLPQVDAFQNAIRNVPEIQYDAMQLKALDEALKPARRLQKIVEERGEAALLAKRLEVATSALRRFRNAQLHVPPGGARRQLPAYRLEDDDA